MFGIIFLVILIGGVSARKTQLEIEGRFLCDDDINWAVYAELRERNVIEDESLDWVNVKANNRFRLRGFVDDSTNEPYLVIRHTCRGEKDEVIVNFGKKYDDIWIEMGDVDLNDPLLQKSLRTKYETD
uniref:Transthyretin domain containing protein n=1 Tax=Haemonchus contortus TaxID=6289 RepID=A0A7I4Z7Q1_HAECO